MKQRLLIIVFVVTAFAAGLAGWFVWRDNKPAEPASPVPASISQAVNYPIYYPDQAKLPAGYTLDTSSFRSPVKNGVNYSVIYGGGKKLIFTLQTKPSNGELATFNSNYIPLRSDFQSRAGQAEIGAYHNETLVSLPIANGPWIIITSPADINQNQLKQVLQSLKKD